MDTTTHTRTSQALDQSLDKEHSIGTDTVSPSSPVDQDTELQAGGNPTADRHSSKTSAFKSLGLLDRFLAAWILLAMAVGIILGNFVPNTGPALQKGQFVGVSVPIGRARSSV